MRSLFRWVLFVTLMVFSTLALADTAPSPLPSPLPVPGLGGWVSGQGGWMAAILSLVIAFNIAVTGALQVCQRLKLAEPAWLQAMGHWGEKILGYLSANTQSPPEAK